jgi:hypothetical protein
VRYGIYMSLGGKGIIKHTAPCSRLPEYRDLRSYTATPYSGLPGRVISPSQRTLPDITQYSQETDIYAPAGFEPTVPASERPQTHALDRATTGIGSRPYLSMIKYRPFVIYRVSQEKCAILRDSVPYVKVYQYNPKYLYPKLNGYGDNVQR